jgi:hypothetical protein
MSASFLELVFRLAIKMIFSDMFSCAKWCSNSPFFKGGSGGICHKSLKIHLNPPLGKGDFKTFLEGYGRPKMSQDLQDATLDCLLVLAYGWFRLSSAGFHFFKNDPRL